MKARLTIYWVRPKGVLEPLVDLPPLDFPSLEEARSAIHQIVSSDDVPVHSVVIQTEDGSVSERWFFLDGTWRRKDV